MARFFEWDEVEDNIDEEYDGDGNVIVEYTTEPGLHGAVICEHRDGQTYYHHHDGEGNTVALTNDQGEVTDTFAFTANGELTERTGDTPTPFRFGGEHEYYTDLATGEVMVRQRPLDPTQGRWLAADPLAAVVTLYVYCGNSAPNCIDPSGLISQFLRSQLESLGFKHILCNASSRGNWFDRMELGDLKATPLQARHIKGPAMGGLESVAGLVAMKRPYSCKDNNLLFVAAFEATNITLMKTIFQSTGAQINAVEVFATEYYLTSSTCKFVINKAYEVKELSTTKDTVHALSAVAVCPVKCKDGQCYPIGFDSIVHAKYVGSFQTRPGQMLLWQARFCPKNLLAPPCCLNSCDVSSFVTQLEDGYNFDSLLPEGGLFARYKGPPWGRSHKPVKTGEEPRPNVSATPAYIAAHKKNGGAVISEPCAMKP